MKLETRIELHKVAK